MEDDERDGQYANRRGKLLSEAELSLAQRAFDDRSDNDQTFREFIDTEWLSDASSITNASVAMPGGSESEDIDRSIQVLESKAPVPAAAAAAVAPIEGFFGESMFRRRLTKFIDQHQEDASIFASNIGNALGDWAMKPPGKSILSLGKDRHIQPIDKQSRTNAFLNGMVEIAEEAKHGNVKSHIGTPFGSDVKDLQTSFIDMAKLTAKLHERLARDFGKNQARRVVKGKGRVFNSSLYDFLVKVREEFEQFNQSSVGGGGRRGETTPLRGGQRVPVPEAVQEALRKLFEPQAVRLAARDGGAEYTLLMPDHIDESVKDHFGSSADELKRIVGLHLFHGKIRLTEDAQQHDLLSLSGDAYSILSDDGGKSHSLHRQKSIGVGSQFEDDDTPDEDMVKISSAGTKAIRIRNAKKTTISILRVSELLD